MSDVLGFVNDRPIRTFTFASGDGDNRYGWDAKDDSWVIPMLQKIIDDGYELWIIRTDPTREVKLRHVRPAALDTRKVVMRSDVARQLFEQGKIGMIAHPVAGSDTDFTLTRERRATSARDAASNDTVAMPRAAGG